MRRLRTSGTRHWVAMWSYSSRAATEAALLSTLRARAISQFGAHGITCHDCGVGFKAIAASVSQANAIEIEQGYLAAAPDVAMAQYFNRMLQFMPDGSHDFVIRLSWIDENSE